MSIQIKAGEYPIAKIFSDDFFFIIPEFQRPYAWTKKEAEELLDDLIAALGTTNREIQEINPYFLGSIVLIKGEGQPDAQVVDGQQRLTTLVILFSVLRELIQNEQIAKEITELLKSPENITRNILGRYRLKLRRDNDFFERYIQKNKQLEQLKKLNNSNYSFSENLIKINALLFWNKLEDFSERNLKRLLQFIAQRCFLVVISNPDFGSACRIFSVLNNRGLNLSMTDILKAELISKIPEGTEQRDSYARKWEDVEELLGRESFENFFANHLWGIFNKTKPSQNTILEELREQMKNEEPEIFIDRTLAPAVKAFSAIENEDYPSSTEVEFLFQWLKQINKSNMVDYWKSPAIFFLFKHWDDSPLVLRFFTDMERLVAGLMILGLKSEDRKKRYLKLSKNIRDEKDIFGEDSPLQLTAKECQKILTILDNNLYKDRGSQVCNYILRRIDSYLAGNEAVYNLPKISVEHVLPQNPEPKSEWLSWFPNQKQREKYLHRLGNLVLLSQKINKDAGRWDFEKKKKIYFSTKNDASPFVLTRQVLQEKKWTPNVIERRQKQLIGILTELWRL